VTISLSTLSIPSKTHPSKLSLSDDFVIDTELVNFCVKQLTHRPTIALVRSELMLQSSATVGGAENAGVENAGEENAGAMMDGEPSV